MALGEREREYKNIKTYYFFNNKKPNLLVTSYAQFWLLIKVVPVVQCTTHSMQPILENVPSCSSVYAPNYAHCMERRDVIKNIRTVYSNHNLFRRAVSSSNQRVWRIIRNAWENLSKSATVKYKNYKQLVCTVLSRITGFFWMLSIDNISSWRCVDSYGCLYSTIAVY